MNDKRRKPSKAEKERAWDKPDLQLETKWSSKTKQLNKTDKKRAKIGGRSHIAAT